MTKHTAGSRFWRAHVEAQVKSGLSRAEYCRRHELSYHALTYWQRKFKRKNISGSPQLIPVPKATISTVSSSKAFDMRVVLPGSIAIELSNGFSSDALARLLPLLASR